MEIFLLGRAGMCRPRLIIESRCSVSRLSSDPTTTLQSHLSMPITFFAPQHVGSLNKLETFVGVVEQQWGATMNLANTDDETPLEIAIRQGQLRWAKALLVLPDTHACDRCESKKLQ